MTNYFGHIPQQKFMMIEKNNDYEKAIAEDPDCSVFKSGGRFFAVVTTSTFMTPLHKITDVNNLVNMNGVMLIVECNNQQLIPYYRSTNFDDNKVYDQIMALITTVIST
jgi:hypothetical protein